MDKFLRKISKIVKLTLNFTSLQFRLTWKIILILVLGFGSLTLWMDWELKHLPIAVNEDGRLWTLVEHLKIISILSIVITATFTSLSIHQSLMPLRQIADIYSTQLKPYPFKLRRMPKEIKTLARNWNQLIARFSEAREQQRQLTNDLAHELRTPLSMIYGFLQRTQQQRENLTDSQQESLDMAVEEAERMVQLLQDWLDLTRLDESVVSLPMESLHLNDLLAEVAEMTEKFEHRAIQVEVPAFPVDVKVEQNQLMQVLNHLLENAIQYSDANEPVIIKLTCTENWAVIQVSDRGCGIPPSQQSRIFDPFYRVDPSRTRATGGAGLGLSLVKRSVENMGGNISVRSQPGEGSTFTLKLPILGGKR